LIRFFTLDYDGAPNFRIMAANMRNPAKERWTELIPESKDLLETFKLSVESSCCNTSTTPAVRSKSTI